MAEEADRDGAQGQAAPASLSQMSSKKLTTFVLGSQRKSRLQKAREAQRRKEEREKVEAAKVFESFVASFDVEPARPDTMFVPEGGSSRPSRTPQNRGKAMQVCLAFGGCWFFVARLLMLGPPQGNL
mmetsp:Transcript_12132/g.45007  ORF Transcript_12132/g.45007 Transcript_12132/m.45007 type:complete len:127 (-) Transcript_12132:369-749(-)|eukprot:scaffold427_cov263-Pinguiococcus_pyrenoidosus.AAC.3